MKIIFVGDRPSRLNHDPDVAFVGTPSHINLCKWVAKMQIAEFIMVNSYTHADHVRICQYYNIYHYAAFVALGNSASKVLEKLDIEHFKLPHPSPRNRLLNSSSFIDSELRKCYLWLKERRNVQNMRRLGKQKNLAKRSL